MGIIPAYAGNTAASIPQVSASWDHPRVCGEHQWQVHDNPMPLGSSPRMRGTLKRVHRHRHATRIIPAYAGNTTARNASTKAKRDHPRVCGEHTLPVSFMLPVLGSSPRMRGTQTMQIRIQPQGGIIPAYAGNTTTTSASSLLCRDHPRVCGEHGNIELIEIVHLGSSPRMRGTLTTGLDTRGLTGIIPAYAGNTVSVVM